MQKETKIASLSNVNGIQNRNRYFYCKMGLIS